MTFILFYSVHALCVSPKGVCQRDCEALPCPARPLVVGLDGGYVRQWHKKSCFEVIAGESIPAERSAKCFGFVQKVDAKPRRRVLEVLRSQGLQANQAVGLFADGAAVLRSLTSYLSAESTHILDWFNLTMRLTVLHQYALGVVQVDAAGGKALQDRLRGTSGTATRSGRWKNNALGRYPSHASRRCSGGQRIWQVKAVE